MRVDSPDSRSPRMTLSLFRLFTQVFLDSRTHF